MRLCATDKLQRRGMESDKISDIYVMCMRAEESIDHLFIHYEVAPFSGDWCHFLKMWLGLVFPGIVTKLVQYWGWEPFHGCGLIIWIIIPFLIL